MELTFVIPAGENEVFAKDAFVGTVGRPIIVEGQPGVVKSAIVDGNGKSVEITVVVDTIVWGDYKGPPEDY